MTAMRCVLMTGAAGNVGGAIRTGLAGHWPELRLTDRNPIDDLGPNETFVRADVRDAAAVAAMMEGVDGVIHLGSIPVEDSWDAILDVNIAGTYALFEAARRAGVRRILLPARTMPSASTRAASASTTAPSAGPTAATGSPRSSARRSAAFTPTSTASASWRCASEAASSGPRMRACSAPC